MAAARYCLRKEPGFEAIYRADPEGNVSIEVIHGAAAVRVTQANVKRAERNTLKLIANGSAYGLTSEGYYRLNVFSENASEMLVYSGTAVTAAGEIGARKRTVIRGENRFASTLDKENVDSFDIWSEWRIALSRFANARRRSWYAGLWFLDPVTGEYTFVPGERVCKSPYGGSYSTMYILNRAARRPRSQRPTLP